MKSHLTKLIVALLTVTLIMSLLPLSAFAYTVGDVDKDGKITSEDSRLALRASVSIEKYAKGSDEARACDADLSGTITPADARLILRASVKLETLHSHSYTTEKITRAATCTADGEKTLTCSCGDFRTEVIPAPGSHTWDAGTITKAATCKEEGVKTFTCSVCGETKTEAVAKLSEHAWNNGEITKAATCKEEGVKTFTCSVCGKTKTEAVAKLSEHAWNNGEITKAATCKEEGVKTFTCSVCGEKKTESIAKLPEHTWNNGEVTKTATCKEEGVKTFTCSVCGEKKTESIARLSAHTWNNGEITTAATCKTAGVKTFTCSVCGEKKTEAVAIDAANHAGGKTVKNAAEATCLTGGDTGDVYCADCGTLLSASAEIPPLGHDMIKYTTAATCYAEGSEYEQCSRCDYRTETVVLPMTDEHNVQTVVTEPSCTTPGFSVERCVNGDCTYYLADTYKELDPATGHTMEKSSVVAPTCTEDGYTVFQCKNCSATEFGEPTSALGHVPGTYKTTVKATCTDDGLKTAACTVCGAEVTAAIAATGHSIIKNEKRPTECRMVTYCQLCNTEFSSQEYHVTSPDFIHSVKATCTQEGKDVQKCKYCNQTFEKTLPMEAHKLASSAVKVDATCTTDGSITYGGGTCSVCKQTIEPGVVVIPALGHTPTAAATCTEAQTCQTCGETLVAALGHNYKDSANVLGSDVNGFYCSRCGQKSTDKAELLATFNGLANNIKKYNFYKDNDRTSTVFNKSVMDTTYTKFDFGIYTSAVKALYDDEMNAAETTYEKPSQKSLSFMFQVAYQSYVSKLEASDIDSISVEKITGVTGAQLLNGYDDVFTVGRNEYNIGTYKQQSFGGSVIKVTLDIRDEYMSPSGSNVNENDPTVPTSLSKIYNYDIRSERELYNENWLLEEKETGEGYDIGMTMGLKKITSDATVVFYFDASNYDPIAAVYDIKTVMDQNVNMNFKIGLFSLDGVIQPLIKTENTSVYLFSDYFPVQ